MNYLRIKPAKLPACVVALLFALLAVLAAHGEEPTGGGRWLFIFDTSSTMKKFMPATSTVLKSFLVTSADGQMQPGDSVGVWAMNQQINGQYPTFAWGSESKDETFSNLVTFLRQQRFSSPSQLAAMSSSLNYVVANSRRLTVVLFTDGQSDLAGTTYDDGVNQMFRDTRDDRRKELQPIVVVMRSQLGKYVGCSINYPPGAVNLPPFPPPPAPPKVVEPPKPPAPTPVTSLVIVGSAVSTNGSEPIPQPKPVIVTLPKPVAIMTNPPIVVTQAAVIPKPVVTNPIAVVIQTNLPLAVTVAPPIVVTKANPVMNPATNLVMAATTEPPQNPNRKWLLIGAGMLVVATTLTLVVFLRSRRLPQSSLISSSMQDDPRRR